MGCHAANSGRSRGGFTCKVHARCDNQGLPLGFYLTGGEASDYGGVDSLMAMPVPKPAALLADKGYDGDRFRENLLLHNILPAYRRVRTARHQSIPTIAAIAIATASSACSASSNTNAASRHASRKPRYPTSASSTSPQQGYG